MVHIIPPVLITLAIDPQLETTQQTDKYTFINTYRYDIARMRCKCEFTRTHAFTALSTRSTILLNVYRKKHVGFSGAYVRKFIYIIWG